MDDESATIEELLEKAEYLEEQGSLEEAIKLLRHARALGKNSEVLTRLGALATDMELWAEAEEALLSAIALDSESTAAYRWLGLLYRAEGKLNDALSCFERALRNEPSASTLTVLGVIQLELGFTEEAKSSFGKAILADSEYEEAYYNLAMVQRNDLKGESIALLQRALDVDSNYELAHRELGWLLRRTNQFPEAEYHLRRAIELDDHDGWAYIYLGNLMWASGDLISAEKAFKKAIEVWPDRSIPYWSLGHFRESQGKKAEAELLYSKALKIDPSDPQANWRFGNYLMDIGDSQKAQSYLHWALELDPSDKRARDALSELEPSRTKVSLESDPPLNT